MRYTNTMHIHDIFIIYPKNKIEVIYIFFIYIIYIYYNREIMGEIIVVEEQEKIHKFYDIHDNHENTYCRVKINIKKFYYNQDIHTDRVRYYYDVSYNYQYVENNNVISNSVDYKPYIITNIKTTNPFYYYRHNISDDSLEGVITICNRVTTAIIEQLLMSDDDLERELCNAWIVQYRTHLMYTLSTFWN